MEKQKVIEKPILETVKIAKKYLDKVREVKKNTYKPIGIFIEEAIVEKLAKENGKKIST